MLNSLRDLKILKQKYNISYLMSVMSNRGFHALLFYRISHFLYNYKIPLLPLIFTRIIQIIYGIDIDYRAKLEGGGNYHPWSRNSYRFWCSYKKWNDNLSSSDNRDKRIGYE